MMEPAVRVVEPEKKRADAVLAALVPAEAGDHAVGGSRVLDLEHRALARLIGAVLRFCDHAVEPGSFELLEPLLGDGAVRGDWGQMQRRGGGAEEPFEPGPAFTLWRFTQVASLDCQDVEGHERGRPFCHQLRDARRCWMQAELERVEVESLRSGNDDLAVEDAASRQLA